MDIRSPRDGRAIEELGHYDPMVRNLEARTVLNVSRIRYWLSVGAQPSDKVQAILNRHKITKPAPGEHWEVPPKPPRRLRLPEPASLSQGPCRERPRLRRPRNRKGRRCPPRCFVLTC